MCELAARKSKKKGNTKLFKHWSHVLQKLRQNRRADINCVQLIVLFWILTRRRGINTLLHICIYKKMRAALKIISFNSFSHLKVLRVGHKFNWYLDAWCFSFLFWIFFYLVWFRRWELVKFCSNVKCYRMKKLLRFRSLSARFLRKQDWITCE